MTALMLRLRARWERWWQARQPPSDTHELTQRNIYIVPTRAGLAFCGTLGLLLIASINEQLSLGYALTFALTGAGLASMHTTHANLRRLQLDLRAPDAAHCGDDVALSVRLHNPAAARYGIGLQAQLGARRTDPAWVDVPAQGHAVVELRFPAPQRGLHELPRLIITTRFPLGFFRAWSYWRPASRVWIYPKPEQPLPPFPAQVEGGEADAHAQAPSGRGTDFSGVRAYRRGDSPRHILWRKSALNLEQGQPLWVRETESPLSQDLWFDLRDTAGRDLEARLSRLTAWLLAAERSQQPYGLRLGGREWPPALGPAHCQDLLQALAAYPA